MNHKAYLALALPLIFSTITTSLLGAVDTAVVGQLPDLSYIAANAILIQIHYQLWYCFLWRFQRCNRSRVHSGFHAPRLIKLFNCLFSGGACRRKPWIMAVLRDL